MDLQKQIEDFVDVWGPDEVGALRRRFIKELRRLLNLYAKQAITHGNLPEVGASHDGLKQ